MKKIILLPLLFIVLSCIKKEEVTPELLRFDVNYTMIYSDNTPKEFGKDYLIFDKLDNQTYVITNKVSTLNLTAAKQTNLPNSTLYKVIGNGTHYLSKDRINWTGSLTLDNNKVFITLKSDLPSKNITLVLSN